jgi:hypothetical protein
MGSGRGDIALGDSNDLLFILEKCHYALKDVVGC